VDERSLKWEQRFEWPMVIAALLVIPLLVIEESDFGQRERGGSCSHGWRGADWGIFWGTTEG
jgi:hypothetical protein